MNKSSFKIDNFQAGKRIDVVLASLLEGLTRSGVQRLIEKERVHVNGSVKLSNNYRLKEGDYLDVYLLEPVVINVRAEDIPLTIIYEDLDLLVVNKAKGMVVHPGPGNMDGTLVNAILHHCKGKVSSINGVIRQGIVHRLDKDTSGLILVAKNDRSHQKLAEQFVLQTVKRVYMAIVYNNFNEDEGIIEAPIGRDPRNRLRMAVTEKNGKAAKTLFRVVERFGQFTLIEAYLETGRTHQIRVHMSYINHPLLGDKIYGPKKPNLKIEGQLLHAKTLGFKHPSTDEFMEFHSPLPEEFQQVIDRLR